MNTGLTTFDGYPRADIDVAQSSHSWCIMRRTHLTACTVRTTRARIIHIRNDYKALMLRIEKAVQAQFAEAASRPTNPQSSTPNAPAPSSSTSPPTSTTPFAKVNSVVAGSPAEDAGLRAQDLITLFGSATWLNHDKLSKVAEVVTQNEGVSLLLLCGFFVRRLPFR
jgi:26S proteasome non-ATPase regulatory subunit 9